MSALDAFVGTWQRVCTGASFGGFAASADAKSFVVVEAADGGAPGAVRWSFGAALGALRVGYSTSLARPAAATAVFTPLTITFAGGSGWGAVRADGVCTLTLLSAGGTLATVTYRVLDADTLAVSITEVPDKGEATVQQGYLFRVLTAQPVVP